MHEEQSEHHRQAARIQAEACRRMPPERRLAQAVRMNRQMRGLMDAGLRMEKPAWSADERRREIARRILFSVTG